MWTLSDICDFITISFRLYFHQTYVCIHSTQKFSVIKTYREWKSIKYEADNIWTKEMIEKSQRDYVLKLAHTLSPQNWDGFLIYFCQVSDFCWPILTLFPALQLEMISGHIVTSAKEVMFSPMYVCLSVSWITRKLIFMKFYGMVGHNPSTSQLDFESPYTKVKVTGGQRSNGFVNNSISSCCRRSPQQLVSAYSTFSISENHLYFV